MTLRLTTSLSSFCVVYCMSASFSFIKSKFPPLHRHPPPCLRRSLRPSTHHSMGVNRESSPDRHQESHQTPVGPRHRRRHWRAVTHKENGKRCTLMPSRPVIAHTMSCIYTQQQKPTAVCHRTVLQERGTMRDTDS